MNILGSYLVKESKPVEGGTEHVLVSYEGTGMKTLVLFIPSGSGYLSPESPVLLRSMGLAVVGGARD